MKYFFLCIIFGHFSGYGQLDLTKLEIEKFINRLTFKQKNLEKLKFDFKVLNKNRDSLKIGNDENNVVKKIIVSNKPLGVFNPNCHELIKLFDPDFRLTDKDYNSDYFYDTFSKHLVQVKYKIATKRKNIEVTFLSDSEQINQFLSKISHN